MSLPGLDELESALNRIVIVDALDSLSREHRAVIVETYYRGRSVAEAARILGVPEGTVKSRCYYALRALKLALAERGVTRDLPAACRRTWARTSWARSPGGAAPLGGAPGGLRASAPPSSRSSPIPGLLDRVRPEDLQPVAVTPSPELFERSRRPRGPAARRGARRWLLVAAAVLVLLGSGPA